MRKQNVFVPKIPGKPTFEEYHEIPQERFLTEAKKAVEDFVEKNGGVYFIRTLGPLKRKYLHVNATTDNDILNINEHKIKPTKWGIDNVGTVFFPKPRSGLSNFFFVLIARGLEYGFLTT
jgi:hypothetical protein